MDSVNEGLKHVAKAKTLLEELIRRQYVCDEIHEAYKDLEKAIDALTKCST